MAIDQEFDFSDIVDEETTGQEDFDFSDISDDEDVKKNIQQPQGEDSFTPWESIVRSFSNIVPKFNSAAASINLNAQNLVEGALDFNNRFGATAIDIADYLIESFRPDSKRDLSKGINWGGGEAEDEYRKNLREIIAPFREESLRLQDEARKKIKPTAGILSSIKEGDIAMIGASLIGVSVDMLMSIVKTASSGGSIPIAEMMGANYYDALQEKAEAEGVTADQLLQEDREDQLVPTFIGIFGGLLENIGVNGVFKEAFKKIPRDKVRKLISASGASLKEGATEYTQALLEIGNKAIAGKSPDDTRTDGEVFSQAVRDNLGSEEVWESAIRGYAGSGVLIGASAAINRVGKNIADGETGAVETIVESEETAESIIQSAIDQEAEVGVEVGEVTRPKTELEEFSEVEEGTKVAPNIVFKGLKLAKEDPTFQEKVKQEIQEETGDTDVEMSQADLDSQQRIEDFDQRVEKTKEVLTSELEESGVDFKKGNFLRNLGLKETFKGLRVSDLRNLPINIASIAKTNEKAMAALDKFIKKPLERAKIVSDVLTRDMRDQVQDYVRQNNIDERSLKRIGMAGMLQSTIANPEDAEAYATELNDNKEKLKRAIENKLRFARGEIKDDDSVFGGKLAKANIAVTGLKKKAQEEAEIAQEIIEQMERGEDLLTPEEQGLKDQMSEFFDSQFEDYANTSKDFFGSDVDQINNYFPTNAIGGFQKQSRTEKLTKEIDDTISGKTPQEKFFNTSDKSKVSKGYHAMDRNQDIGNAFYEFDASKLFLDYVKNTSLEIESTPVVKEINQVLSDKGVVNKLGKDAQTVLLRATKAFVNREHGVRRPEAVKAMDAVRANVITTLLGSLNQLPKQFLPSLTQATIFAKSPANYAKALKALATTNKDWYKEHAPGLYERSLSADRITLGDDTRKVVAETGLGRKVARGIASVSQRTTTAPISIGDIGAARLVFLSSFLGRGGDMKNPDPEIVRQAELDQEILQNVNTASFSGKFFNSEKDFDMFLTRTMFTFMNFAMQQSFAFGTGLANLDKGRGRQLAASSAASAISFAIIANTIRELRKARDDEEEEDFSPENIIGKGVVKGAKDLLVPYPILSSMSERQFETLNKKIRGKDYDKEKHQVFYIPFKDEGMEEVMGPAFAEPADRLGNLYANFQDLIFEEDKGEIVELMGLEAAQFLNQVLPILPLRGDVNTQIRESIKQQRKDIKAARKKASKKKSKTRSRKRINVDNL